MSIRVINQKNSNFHCLMCEYRGNKIVCIEINKAPKKAKEVFVGVDTFLCEDCFKRLFGSNNWLRHWRIDLKRRIIKRNYNA